MPKRQEMLGRRPIAHRAAPPTEACTCNRSLLDVEARKTGSKDPGERWKRKCTCGAIHYYGDMK
jgi:hypothetical protein